MSEKTNDSTEIKKDVGGKIQELRKAAGLTQKQLSEKVGSYRDHISKVESGKVNSSLDYLTKIADALKINVKELFK